MTKPSVALKQYPSNIGLDSDVDFLRSLLERGLKGVQLVISDAHEGLKTAISQVLTGATWQRCRVHFMCTRWPEAAKLLEEAEDDILTFVAFPQKHWIRI
jgi:putative transposase